MLEPAPERQVGMMPKQLFIPITKVDLAKREVWGRAAQEVPDKASEILDYATSKPLFEQWSAEFDKATDGLSLGNVRAMHGRVAAGKVVAFATNDAEKAFDIGAKIVDDQEWRKVEEGVYTGFSIGGDYVGAPWPDPTDKALKRYTAKPSEVSLVDNPCIPTARFTVLKADGATEERPFKAPEPPAPASPIDELLGKLATVIDERVAAAVAPLEKQIAERTDTSPKGGEDKYGKGPFADETNKKYPIDTKAHAKAAWNYINKPKNAAKYSAADLKTIKGKIKAAAKKFGIAISEEAKDAKKAAFAAELRKGLYGVTCLAQLLEQLEYCATDAEWEADYEGDDSDIPMRLHVWMADGLEILREMVAEETEELAQKHGQSLEAAAPAGDLAKMTTALDAVKGDLAKMASENADLLKRVAELEAQPAPGKGQLRVVGKDGAVEAVPDRPAVAKVARSPGEATDALDLIKGVHQNGAHGWSGRLAQ